MHDLVDEIGGSRFLLVTIPAFGHALPLLGLANRLAQRGHRVLFATSSFFVPQIRSYCSSNLVRFVPLDDGVNSEVLLTRDR